ncbi:MAG: tyrosine-type recombinase/integrase, partial [Gallionella sp.]
WDMALTAIEVKSAKASDKPRKLADGGGMFLLVNANGAKYWKFSYRYGGKQKTLALGVFPDTSLNDARGKREEARRLLASGIDPCAAKQATKAAVVALADSSFEAVAREWLHKFGTDWSASHIRTYNSRLVNDVFPWIGARPIAEITPPELLAVLRRIESRGALDSAHRTRSICGLIFRYAVSIGKAQRDPSRDLDGAIPPHQGKHLAAITDPVKIGKLMRDIQAYRGSYQVRYALQLAPLVFLRPIELSRAQWCEIDLDAAVWRIPADKMKMKRVHIVPLSKQAVAILREIYPLSGRGAFVFPSARTGTLPMAKHSLLAALRGMGYSPEEMTAHGFRHMASTMLNEQGFHADAIERQLAHAPSGVRGVYNAAQYMNERVRIMQHWADYLDGLAAGAQVIPLRA